MLQEEEQLIAATQGKKAVKGKWIFNQDISN